MNKFISVFRPLKLTMLLIIGFIALILVGSLIPQYREPVFYINLFREFLVNKYAPHNKHI